jgi:hypothetical protein
MQFEGFYGCWILPKQLHTSVFAVDTEALISDSNEQSQICAQSLTVRSKALPLRTWSQKWKKDSWIQHLSGRILKPSHGESFVDAWTSLVVATRASHSVPQENDLERKTTGTCGHSSQLGFQFADPESASLRTSKGTLRWDSQQSSATWKNWVTKSRGEYSQRLKSAHHISESESFCWPTASSRDWKDTPGMSQTGVNPDGSHRKRVDQLARAVYGEEYLLQETALTRTAMSRDGNAQFAAKTTSHVDAPVQPTMAMNTGRFPESYLQGESNSGPVARANRSFAGNHQGLLNPRWTEALMGLPVGWAMPTCTSPVTIEQMN